MLVALGCGKQASAPVQKPTAVVPQKVAEEKPKPYTYPPPVKGHFEEINVGDFDLVDGLAYPARGGAGTVVYVSSKEIASPVLTDSPCPMTQARALTVLRNAGYVEVTLDAAGRSKYFASGKPFGGSGREEEVGGRYWSSKVRREGGRAAGSVRHKNHGGFEFDLPVLSPKITEVSEGERVQGRRSDESAPALSEQGVTAAYRAAREASLRKDLKGLLVALGFDEKQTAAIPRACRHRCRPGRLRRPLPRAGRPQRVHGQRRLSLRLGRRRELQGGEVHQLLPFRALPRAARAGQHQREPAIAPAETESPLGM